MAKIIRISVQCT